MCTCAGNVQNMKPVQTCALSEIIIAKNSYHIHFGLQIIHGYVRDLSCKPNIYVS